MSQIPPASIRVTSRTLNYQLTGSSHYYFDSQLKQNLVLNKAIKTLGKMLFWPIKPSKRNKLSVLQPGVLPIGTQLRMNKFMNLLIDQSTDWFYNKHLYGSMAMCSSDLPSDKQAQLIPLPTLLKFCKFSGRTRRHATIGNNISPKFYVNTKQRTNLFMLLCLRLLVRKTLDMKSNVFVNKASVNFNSNAFVAPKRGKQSVTYDFQFLQELDALTEPSNLTINNYQHYPKATLKYGAKLDPWRILTDERTQEISVVPNKGKGRNRNQTISNVTNSLNKNVTPKVALCRRFNSPVTLHLFHYIEGRYSNSKKTIRNKPFSCPHMNQQQNNRPTPPRGQTALAPEERLGDPRGGVNKALFIQGLTSSTYDQKIGLNRLNSAVVFEFHLMLSAMQRHLRPTVSIRL